jgi:nitrate/nitrite transporter NarK
MLSDRLGLFRATMITPGMMILSGIILLYAIRFQKRGQGLRLTIDD